MLIATPYRSFDVRDRSPPRVISEIRKSYANCSLSSFRPRLTGDLLLKYPESGCWCPGRVSVRCGQLVVWAKEGSNGIRAATVRLPLRHLSLRAGPLPNSLALCRGNNVVLTMQASSQRAFDEWVKTIAIELIRQTPLDAIKYLDILTIAECWKRRDDCHEKDWNYNDCSPDKTKTNTSDDAMEECVTCQSDSTKAEAAPTKADVWRREPLVIKNREERIPPIPPPRTPEKVSEVPEEIEEKQVEDLMKKCQNVENYVPVKEKLFLFESLCKLGRKVRSTEDVSLKIDTNSKRARSLHDLSNLNSHIAVREICKYFENKNETQEKTPETQVAMKFKLKRTLECNNVYHRFPRAIS